MNNTIYTSQELMTTKFYELPNHIYHLILSDIIRQFGFITTRMLEILNNTPVYQLDQYVDIYKYIHVI